MTDWISDDVHGVTGGVVHAQSRLGLDGLRNL